jgi:hypothetical protein
MREGQSMTKATLLKKSPPGRDMGVVLSAVTTLAILILLEGLLDDDTKTNINATIVVVAVTEVILDVFVISPELDSLANTRPKRTGGSRTRGSPLY